MVVAADWVGGRPERHTCGCWRGLGEEEVRGSSLRINSPATFTSADEPFDGFFLRRIPAFVYLM